MKLTELKNFLTDRKRLSIKLPDGALVPAHFHVTEVGTSTKSFIDCGGTLRSEDRINLQLWSATDYDHRLHPEKLREIIELSEAKLGLRDVEIEVEYQGDKTIEKFGLAVVDDDLVLEGLLTTCLAADRCDVEVPQPAKRIISIASSSACTPGGGCC